MANVKHIIPYLIKWEGGLSRHKSDRASINSCPTKYLGHTGWHTNKGITYATWKSIFGSNNDMRFLRMKDEDFEIVLKKLYWDRWKADNIENQAVANILVDWVWASGVWGIKYPQRLLGVKDDGIVGPKTLEAVNKAGKSLIPKLMEARRNHFRNIGKGSQAVFLKGWLNRMNGLEMYNRKFV